MNYNSNLQILKIDMLLMLARFVISSASAKEAVEEIE